MNKRKLFFFGYCAVAILVPSNPHPYTYTIITLIFISNFFCHHYFREFLNSGTPASKTVLHGLLKGLTVSYQLLLTFFYIWAFCGLVMATSIENGTKTHPSLVCILGTPRWVVLPLFLYLFYLASFKLIIALKPDLFMALNHEVLATRLNISVFVLMLLDSFVEVLVKGSTCNLKIAILVIRYSAGVETNFDALQKPLEFDWGLLINFCLILGTVVQYAVSEIVLNSTIITWYTFCSSKIRSWRRASKYQSPKNKDLDLEENQSLELNDIAASRVFTVQSPASYTLKEPRLKKFTQPKTGQDTSAAFRFTVTPPKRQSPDGHVLHQHSALTDRGKEFISTANNNLDTELFLIQATPRLSGRENEPNKYNQSASLNSAADASSPVISKILTYNTLAKNWDTLNFSSNSHFTGGKDVEKNYVQNKGMEKRHFQNMATDSSTILEAYTRRTMAMSNLPKKVKSNIHHIPKRAGLKVAPLHTIDQLELNLDVNSLHSNISANSKFLKTVINRTPRNNSSTQFQKMLSLIKGIGFFAGFFFLLLVSSILFVDELNNIAIYLFATGLKIILQCMPMYWLILVDNVHIFAKRRITAVMSTYFNIF